MHLEETIAAIASSPAGGLRGIVRVSGPHTVPCLDGIFRATDTSSPWQQIGQARRIAGQISLDSPLGEVPCDLYLWPTDRSYTRQPSAELHTFGAPPVLKAALQVVCRQGARLASPGEFTLRAFLAGRIDLAQAEAVLGVIDAVDHRQLEVGLRQLAGGLSGPLTTLRDQLLNMCADLEASLDFVDEDIEFISNQQLAGQLEQAVAQIAKLESKTRLRDTGSSLPRVVLRGEPNVGKSSLWNAIVGDCRAIVTDQAGTTRDYLAATIDHGHVAFTLIDTAGVEPVGQDALQEAIQERAAFQSEQADLVLFCVDASRPLSDWEQSELARGDREEMLVVQTKIDRCPHAPGSIAADVLTSASTGIGVQTLLKYCADRLHDWGGEAAVVTSTAVRCRQSLRLAGDGLRRALELARTAGGDELIAAEVRTALEHLGQVVGAVYTEDVLDRVFSRFCIGK